VYQAVPALTSLTLQDHPAILDAFERHDAARARSLMEDHVRRAGDVVVAHLEHLRRASERRQPKGDGAGEPLTGRVSEDR
jgi:DNA-binding GntR family transcriptional regulator